MQPSDDEEIVYDVKSDDEETEEDEPSTSRRKVKPKAKPKSKGRKTAASRGRGKEKAKAVETPAEEAPASTELPMTDPSPLDDSPDANVKSNRPKELALPIGAAGWSKPASTQKPKKNADQYINIPVTVQDLEGRLPKFDTHAYDIMDEMDSDFDEQIDALKGQDSPDLSMYVTKELERSSFQLAAIRRKPGVSSEVMRVCELRHSALKQWEGVYRSQAQYTAGDGEWTDQPDDLAGRSAHAPKVVVSSADGAGVDDEGDVEMQAPGLGGE